MPKCIPNFSIKIIKLDILVRLVAVVFAVVLVVALVVELVAAVGSAFVFVVVGLHSLIFEYNS